VFGTPIAFAVTGFLHLVPDTGAADIYTGLRDYAALWLAIHVAQLLLILLLAVAVYWLTEGLTSTAARVSRVALLPYLVFYSAFDAVVGLSNGLVVQYGSELPPAEQAVLPGASDALADTVNQPVPLTIYHRNLVVGGCRHRRCSCSEPGRGTANSDDSIRSGRSHRGSRSRCAIWTSRDAALRDGRIHAQPAGNVQATPEPTGRT
jgi:hypothetical protein